MEMFDEMAAKARVLKIIGADDGNRTRDLLTTSVLRALSGDTVFE